MSLLTEASCCHPDIIDTDTILLSIHIPQRGTLSRLRSGVTKLLYPKGARPIRGATIYVVRLDKMGRLALARPCDPCMSELYQHEVRRVVYSVPTGYVTENLWYV